jgi:hypothetical protein
MKLPAARALQAKIKAAGPHCIVPLGHGPAGYFCRIFTSEGPRDFHGHCGWGTYHRASLKRRAKAHEEYERMLSQMRRPRSPIELMIDRACGLS